MEEGDVFSDRDVLNANKVCMVGTTIKRELFDNESPVGKDLRISNVAFRVIGVLSSKGANMMGRDQDDIVVAPWTTIKFRLNAVSANAVANANPTESQAPAVHDQQPQQHLSELHGPLSFDLGRRAGRHPAIRPPGDRRQSPRQGRLRRADSGVHPRNQEPAPRAAPYQDPQRGRRHPRRLQHPRHDRTHPHHVRRLPP